MTKPSWHKVDLFKVPAKPAGLWTAIGDYIIGPRLLRLQVVDKDANAAAIATTWSLDAATACSPDGLIDAPAAMNLLLPTALRGALIGKLGGGSADLPESTAANTPITTMYPGRRVFTVGAYCVIRVSADDSGQLFLTANDAPKEMAVHTGALHVLIEEASI
jgi:hypothetical protein